VFQLIIFAFVIVSFSAALYISRY